MTLTPVSVDLYVPSSFSRLEDFSMMETVLSGSQCSTTRVNDPAESLGRSSKLTSNCGFSCEPSVVGAHRILSWVILAQPGLFVMRYWMHADRSVSAHTWLLNSPTRAKTFDASARTLSLYRLATVSSMCESCFGCVGADER